MTLFLLLVNAFMTGLNYAAYKQGRNLLNLFSAICTGLATIFLISVLIG